MKSEKTAAGMTVTASHAEAKGGSKTLSSVEIQPSKNGGFSVRQSYRSTGEKGAMMGPYIEPETYTFESLDSLNAHLASVFGKGGKK